MLSAQPRSLAGRAGAPPTALRPTVIRPPGRWPGLGLGELWRQRSICLVLAKRNLKVRYRQTLLGAGWAVLQPMILMLVFTVFFGLLARLPSDGLPYPVFFFTALAIWQVAAKVLNEGSASVVANAALVNRVYFPRTYFPVSVALASLVDLAFNGLALAILLLAFGYAPSLPLIVVPVLVALMYATSLGVAFWLSAINVAFRDVAVLLAFVTQLWFFSTPIIYPASIIPEQYEALYYLNPMALVVTALRWALVGAPAPPLEAWPLGIGVVALLLVSGYLFFRQREQTFSDVI
ncbi:MAG TPA: ABC transporter permease [Candidatus Limnocylindria bacterium]|nr:ABC transporter permease [Candidatus Limnocylindria bacterium]